MGRILSSNGRLEVRLDGKKIVRREKINEFEYEMSTEDISPNIIDINYYALSKEYGNLDSVIEISGERKDPSMWFEYPISMKNGEFNLDGYECETLGRVYGEFDNGTETYHLVIEVGDYYREFIQRNIVDADGNLVREFTYNDSKDRDKVSSGNGFSLFERIYEDDAYDYDEETDEEYVVGVHKFKEVEIFGRGNIPFLYWQDMTDNREELSAGANEALILYSEDGQVYDDEDMEVDFGIGNIYDKFVLPRIEFIWAAFDYAKDNFPEISSSMFELDHEIQFHDPRNLTFNTTKNMTVGKILERVKRRP